MQKSRKHEASNAFETRNPRRSTVPLPEVVSIDVLSTMKDEDLIVRLRFLDEEKNRAYDAHGDTRPWEEEIAYIRREQQIRRGYRDRHSEYLRSEKEAFDASEAGLQTFDFEKHNATFVYAANGGRPRWN